MNDRQRELLEILAKAAQFHLTRKETLAECGVECDMELSDNDIDYLEVIVKQIKEAK